MGHSQTIRGNRVVQDCGYTLPEEVLHDFPEFEPCERTAVIGQNCCWLHLGRDSKPINEIREAWYDQYQNAGAVLRNIDFTEHSLDFSGRNIPGVDFQQTKLDDVDFRNSTLAYSDFRGSSLSDADFRYDETNIARCCFDSTDCKRAKFSGCEANEATFVSANIESTRFCDTQMSYADFTECRAQQAKFIDADLAHAYFVDANLRGVSFRHADVSEASFSGSNLHKATFTDSKTHRIDLRGAIANDSTNFGDISIYERQADKEAEEKAGLDLSRENECYFSRLRRSFRRGLQRFFHSGDLYRTNQLELAADVYRAYQQLFRENSLPRYVRQYEIREQDANRKRQLATGEYMSWLKLSGSQKLFKYSFSPYRPLGWSMIILVIFAGLFAVSGFRYDGVTYQACLCLFPEGWFTALSTSFTASLQTFLPGAGPGDGVTELNPWIVNIEAAFGTLAISIFVFTLGQRVRH